MSLLTVSKGRGDIMSIQKTLSILIATLFTTVGMQAIGFAKSQDDDSVRSWGRWATLVKPAAGPQIPIPLAGGLGLPDGTDLFRPIVNDDDGGDGGGNQVRSGQCAAGVICGYALIQFIQEETSLVDGSKVSTSIGRQAATPVLAPIPVGAGSGSGPKSLNLQAGPDTQTSLSVVSNTDVSLEQTIVDADVTFTGNAGNAHFWTATTTNQFISGTTLDVMGKLFAYGTSRESAFTFDLSVPSFTNASTSTGFIYGETTDLDELNVGNVQATYDGSTLLSGVPVTLNIDFGTGTFDGSVNNGVNGAVTVTTDINGVDNLTGAVGFEVSGIIDGANIVSTNISAADATSISGTFDGSFYGGDGSILAGSYNVDKATADAAGNNQDLFVTTETPAAQPN